MEGIVGILISIAAVTGVFALVLVAVVIGGIGWGVRRAIYAVKGEEYRPLLGDKTQHDYEHQDLDAGATYESITAVLKRYTNAVVVGQRAKTALAQLQNEKRKNANFHAVLEKKFQRSSLSWSKFAVAGDSTHDGVLRNCASLANRIQVFDRTSYHQQERGHRSSTYKKTEMLDPATAEKQRVLQQGLDEMDQLLRANDELLTQLDKLTLELGKLTDAETSADSERIVEQIQTLIEETKYYSQ